MTTATSSRPQPVLERYGWSFVALWSVATLVVLACAAVVVVQLVDLVQWLQPGARVPVTLDSEFRLPAAPGTNSYSGGPFIADGVRVFATGVDTEVSGLAPLTVVALALAPASWAVTVGSTAVLLGRAAYRLRFSRAVDRLVVRLLRVAALVLAIGSTAAQLLDATAHLGLGGGIAWNGAVDSITISGGGATFSFVPLLLAVGLLATSTVLARAADPDGGR